MKKSVGRKKIHKLLHVFMKFFTPNKRLFHQKPRIFVFFQKRNPEKKNDVRLLVRSFTEQMVVRKVG